MYRMRAWSVRHARAMNALYQGIERLLSGLYPLLNWIGFSRLEKPVFAVEKVVKGVLLDSQSCGQCIVGSTGMSCPMNCPKSLRNGPCGGVRADGGCEVKPGMTCVWVLAWQGNQQMVEKDWPIQRLQPAVDHRLQGHSAWLREVRRHALDLQIQEGDCDAA